MRIAIGSDPSSAWPGRTTLDLGRSRIGGHTVAHPNHRRGQGRPHHPGGRARLLDAQGRSGPERPRDASRVRPPGHPPPPRRQGRAGPAGALADHAHGDAAALRARSANGKRVCGRVLRPRDLRRLRRPDAPEARARAVVDVPGARPARALRGGRRRAHPDGQRAVPHPHAPGHHRLRARPAAVVPGVGPLRPGPLLLCRRPRRRRDLPRSRRLRAATSSASAARAATGSSTCRRPRRSTRTWSRGSARRG